MGNKRKKSHIVLWSILATIFFFVVSANINYLYKNSFANHERVVDFGKNEKQGSFENYAMALIFYNQRMENKDNLATYWRHFDNYKKQKIKMVLLDNKLTPEYQKFMQNLSSEILAPKQVDEILLIHNDNKIVGQFVDIIRKVWQFENIEVLDFAKQEIVTEEKITEALQSDNVLVVMLSDINAMVMPEKSDIIMNEAIYFAQKYSFVANVVDTVDAEISTVKTDYSVLAEYDLRPDELIRQQQNSLQLYVDEYGSKLMKFLVQKLQSREVIKYIDKHLRDRGSVYVELKLKKDGEITKLTAFRENSGIIMALQDIAEQFSSVVNKAEVRNVKIYLLTDREYVENPHQMLQAGFLAADDGVWVEYGHLSGFVTGDQRLALADSWLNILHQTAGIPDMVVADDVKYYKFKTVEIEYEN